MVTIRSFSCNVDPCAIASMRCDKPPLVRSTAFRPVREAHADARLQFHELYDELIADEARNRLICNDIIQTAREGRSPIVLTERNEHLDRLAAVLSPAVRQLVVLRGGMGRR